MEHLHNGESFRGIEWYLPYFYDAPASLLDYMPDGSVLIIDDGADLVQTLQELEEQAINLRVELERSGELPSGFGTSFFSAEELKQALTDRQPLVLGYGQLDGTTSNETTDLARSFAPGPRFGGKTKEIVREIDKLRTAGHQAVLVTRQAARLQELLAEADFPVHVQSDLTQPPVSGITLIQGVMSDGFILRGIEGKDGDSSSLINGQSEPINLHLLTDTELFGWSKPRARRKSTTRSTVAPEIFFADVKAGDFVVHLEHGIGQYDGLMKMELNGIEREYLQVTYAKGDKLFVPVHQADRLSRYVGASDGSPSRHPSRHGRLADGQRTHKALRG